MHPDRIFWISIMPMIIEYCIFQYPIITYVSICLIDLIDPVRSYHCQINYKSSPTLYLVYAYSLFFMNVCFHRIPLIVPLLQFIPLILCLFWKLMELNEYKCDNMIHDKQNYMGILMTKCQQLCNSKPPPHLYHTAILFL